MKKILLSIMSVVILYAQECHYDIKKLDVEWEAYKTPLKIGVKGSFDKIAIEASDTSSQKAFIKTLQLKIDTRSINSKNANRDAKLVKFFFEIQNVKEISIKAISLYNHILTLEITMNGITKQVPMKIEFDDEIEAQGHIDLADFKMLPSLVSINKACYDLHKGKTWQDIEIEFEMKLKKVCN